MARRGTPLPIALRQEIKRRRYEMGETVRAVASLLGVDKETVSRYAPSKFRTKLLSQDNLIP